jgi:hypothetical protein
VVADCQIVQCEECCELTIRPERPGREQR